MPHYCPKYPPALEIGSKCWQPASGTCRSDSDLRSRGESDQLAPGSDQQDPSNLIRSLSRSNRAPRAHALKLFSASPALLLLTFQPPLCCLIWATFLWARISCFLGHNLQRTHFHVFGSFDAYSTSRRRPVINWLWSQALGKRGRRRRRRGGTRQARPAPHCMHMHQWILYDFREVCWRGDMVDIMSIRTLLWMKSTNCTLNFTQLYHNCSALV